MSDHQYHVVIRYKKGNHQGGVFHFSAEDPKVLAKVIAEGHLDERFYRSDARMMVELEVFPPSASINLDSEIAKDVIERAS